MTRSWHKLVACERLRAEVIFRVKGVLILKRTFDPEDDFRSFSELHSPARSNCAEAEIIELYVRVKFFCQSILGSQELQDVNVIALLVTYRQKRKTGQPAKPHSETKESSPPVSCSKDRVAHIIHELSELSDMEAALSPLPPSPERNALEDSSSSEASEDEAQASDSDSSLGDLADMLMGAVTDSGEFPARPSGTELDTSICEADGDPNLIDAVEDKTSAENHKMDLEQGASERKARTAINDPVDNEDFEKKTSNDSVTIHRISTCGETDVEECIGDLTSRTEERAVGSDMRSHNENSEVLANDDADLGCEESKVVRRSTEQTTITEEDAKGNNMEIENKVSEVSGKDMEIENKISEVPDPNDVNPANRGAEPVDSLSEKTTKTADCAVDAGVEIDNTITEKSAKYVAILDNREMEQVQSLPKLGKRSAVDNFLENVKNSRDEETSREKNSQPVLVVKSQNGVTKHEMASKHETSFCQGDNSPSEKRKSSRAVNASKKDQVSFGAVETANQSIFTEGGLSPSPRRKEKCHATSPTSRVMTRSRAKAMRLSASSEDDYSASEKWTGNDLNSSQALTSEDSDLDLQHNGVVRKITKDDEGGEEDRNSSERKGQGFNAVDVVQDQSNSGCPVHPEDSVSSLPVKVSTTNESSSVLNKGDGAKKNSMNRLVNSDIDKELKLSFSPKSENYNKVSVDKVTEQDDNSNKLSSNDPNLVTAKPLNDVSTDEQISSQDKDDPSVAQNLSQTKETVLQWLEGTLEKNNNEVLNSFEDEPDQVEVDFIPSLNSDSSEQQTQVSAITKCSVFGELSSSSGVNDKNITEEKVRFLSDEEVKTEAESTGVRGTKDENHGRENFSLIPKETTIVCSEVKEAKCRNSDLEMDGDLSQPLALLRDKGLNSKDQDSNLQLKKDVTHSSVSKDETASEGANLTKDVSAKKFCLPSSVTQSLATKSRDGSREVGNSENDAAFKSCTHDSLGSDSFHEMSVDKPTILATATSTSQSLAGKGKDESTGDRNFVSSVTFVNTSDCKSSNSLNEFSQSCNSVSFVTTATSTSHSFGEKCKDLSSEDQGLASAVKISNTSDLRTDNSVKENRAVFSNTCSSVLQESSVIPVDHLLNCEEKTCGVFEGEISPLSSSSEDAELSSSSNKINKHSNVEDIIPACISKTDGAESVLCHAESVVEKTETWQTSFAARDDKKFSTVEERKKRSPVKNNTPILTAGITEPTSLSSSSNTVSAFEENDSLSFHAHDTFENTPVKRRDQEKLTAQDAMRKLQERIGDQFLTLSPLPPSPCPSDDEPSVIGDLSFSELPPLSPLPPSPPALIDEVGLAPLEPASACERQTRIDAKEIPLVNKITSSLPQRNLIASGAKLPPKSVKRKVSTGDTSVVIKRSDRGPNVVKNLCVDNNNRTNKSSAEGENRSLKRSLQETVSKSENESIFVSRFKKMRSKQSSVLSEGVTTPSDVASLKQSRSNVSTVGLVLKRKACNIETCSGPKTEHPETVRSSVGPRMVKRCSNTATKTGPTVVQNHPNIETNGGTLMDKRFSSIASYIGPTPIQPANVDPGGRPMMVNQHSNNAANNGPMVARQFSQANNNSCASKVKAEINTKSKLEDVSAPAECTRSLSTRPLHMPEVKYAYRCLTRLYEDSVEVKVIVQRFAAKRCISSCTPLASAIVQFLKAREDDTMPLILDQLEKNHTLQEWKPVQTGFEERLLEMITQLSQNHPMFGNFVPQLVNLCCRGVITGQIQSMDGGLKGVLSLWYVSGFVYLGQRCGFIWETFCVITF